MTSITPEAFLFQQKWKLAQNPFLFYSAENLDEGAILRLFVADPDSSLAAFSFNVNNIISGTYGAGKTMCLRAVEALAVSQLLVDITDSGRTTVLPVRVNLSEIAHLSDPEHVYHAIIHAVFKSLGVLGRRIRKYAQEGRWWESFRSWRQMLGSSGIYTADPRYEEGAVADLEGRVRAAFEKGAKTPACSLIEALAEASGREKFLSLTDLNHVHQTLLSPFCDRLLLLVDEVGSLRPDFFVTKGTAPSSYEILMNQLRTSPSLYYKVCVYPGHYSDTLQETRYGTRINLDYSIRDATALRRFESICRTVLWKYISDAKQEGDPRVLDDFISEHVEDQDGTPEALSCSRGNGSAFEQLCLGSLGVMRRLFALTGKIMVAVAANPKPRVDRNAVLSRLQSFGTEMLSRHSTSERNQILEIADVCIRAATYRFSAEIDTQSLLKPFLSKTQQDSVLSVSESSSGRTVYEFDYAYCVASDLVTHVHTDTKEKCAARSPGHAVWVDDVADVTEAAMRLSGLTRGVIAKYFQEKQFGFIVYNPDEPEVFFHLKDIIEFGGHTERRLRGCYVRFALGDSPRGKKARSVVVEEEPSPPPARSPSRQRRGR